MAELALLASIVQIADTGYRLSLKLYTSGEAISSADRTIVTISKDISLTSTVLKELGEILRRDQEEKERICSENLIQTAGNTVKECLDAFEELDKMILKNMPNLSQGHRATRATMALEKLKWPFIQPRVQLLRGSLDMLRANISLMLNVLIYARHVSDRLVSRHIARYSRCLIKKFYSQAFRKKLRAPAPDVYDEARQKTIIEELVNAKDEYVRKFESLKLSIPASPLTQTLRNMSSRAAPAPTEGNIVPTQPTFNTLPTSTFQYAPTPAFNPSYVNTFQKAPAPQHTPDTFSTKTYQHTPAPQRPLPNTPASYPTLPMDPVAVQSDQYIAWPLSHHLNTLVASLIREVSSPVYQIPAESRSRFTGVIRATHTTEIVEAERREQRRYADWGHCRPSAYQHSYSCKAPPPASWQYEPPSPQHSIAMMAPPPASRQYDPPLEQEYDAISARRTSGPSNLFMPIPASGPRQPAPPPIRRPSVHQQRSPAFQKRAQVQSPRREHEDDEEQPAIKRLKYDGWEVSASTSDFSGDEDKPSQTYQAFEDQPEVPEPEGNDVVDISQDGNMPMQMLMPMHTYQAFGDQPWCGEIPEPGRNDVVDDLVKLWTLVQ